MQKVAIIGAGFAGMSAALELNRHGYEVWIFEKAAVAGGAAGGFKRPGWNWYVDFAYHHWFTNDHEVLKLAKQIGFDKVLVRRPVTASLYEKTKSEKQKVKNELTNPLFNSLFGQNTQIYKLDTPLDLLKFDRLSLFDRLRTGAVLASLKFAPKLPFYDVETAKSYLTNTMGKSAYNTLWEPLFAKKFGTYKNDINMAFFWARVNKRTPSLAYPEGGFQEFINKFASYLTRRGVKIIFNTDIKSITRENRQFEILSDTQKYDFDIVINTLQTPLFLSLQNNVLTEQYNQRLSKIKYIGAQTVIYEMNEKVLKNTYWLNITPPDNPWMVAIQHTNFMDKEHFGGNHIFYLATYTEKPITKSEKLKVKSEKEILWEKEFFIPYAQPLYTTDFVKHMPHAATPTKGLYFANMELTYPYDRGTNYAVKVGLDAARAILEKRP